MIKIRQKNEAVLRETARNVKPEEITSSKIQKIIRKMKAALASQDDGVAIAAPQINVPLRIFIVSGKVETLMKKPEKTGTEIGPPESARRKNKIKDSVYINPEIKKKSRTKIRVDEGCLSVRYLYGKVARAEKATIEAYDENGNRFTRGGSGLLAQIFQHEIDHLNGILFIDKADDIVEILPQKNDK